MAVKWHYVVKVLRRESRIILSKPIYLLASVATIAFCAVFYLTFFRDGVPNDLPIGIVDNDNSSFSRNFARQIDATQLGKVIKFNSYLGQVEKSLHSTVVLGPLLRFRKFGNSFLICFLPLSAVGLSSI